VGWRHRRGGDAIAGEQGRQGGGANTKSGAAEEVSPRQIQIKFTLEIHGKLAQEASGPDGVHDINSAISIRRCQFFVTVSSMLSNRLAIIVQAANSVGLSDSSRGLSPSERSWIAASESCSKVCWCAARVSSSS